LDTIGRIAMNDPRRPPTPAAPGGSGFPAAGRPEPGERWELTREALDRLLEALDPDRAEAGRKYVEVRDRLIRLFGWRGCPHPEELADEAINRVAHKVAGGVEIRAEDPFRYFCGVAYMVFKETLRRARRERTALDEVRREPPPPPPEPEDGDERLSCLRSCLGSLPDDNRELILDYHRGEKGARIRNRKRLADRLGIPINALRIRVHRLRARLEACVATCVENANRS
jgi:DNA-directed RNA polymerase specialized sigma24 family protein